LPLAGHDHGLVVLRRRFVSSEAKKEKAAQDSAYDFYAKRRNKTTSFWFFRTGGAAARSAQTAARDNINTAWYMLALAVGTLGAAYAAVPLYKVFCQTTGYGGTTQRVTLNSGESDQQPPANQWLLSSILPPDTIRALQSGLAAIFPFQPRRGGAKVHTWTDDDAVERLRTLKPVANAELITVRFDTTVPDVMPWSFVPVQLDVKIVPGETALSFFRVTNHSNKAITGVATYNVHPPKVGLYFQKVQCFCFEEQRLLPGETVDMPVFFFIDPEMLNDPQVSYVKSVTLSYTFFKTDEDDED
jgi:cytochrome c oxidase assembly protein subunit 11